jgi:dienelactone hydrolase
MGRYQIRRRHVKAFVVYPERKDKAPAVLVIQEILA